MLTVRLLGGLRAPQDGEPNLEVALTEGFTVADLRDRLRELGYDPTSAAIIITLNGKGLQQWPSDRPVEREDDVAVFQQITGGIGGMIAR